MNHRCRLYCGSTVACYHPKTLFLVPSIATLEGPLDINLRLSGYNCLTITHHHFITIGVRSYLTTAASTPRLV